MELRIALPDNLLFDDLVSQINEVKSDFEPILIRTDKSNIQSYLINNLADVALLSPLEYASAFVSADLRIIPTTCIAGTAYTGLMTIIFQPGLQYVKNCAVPYQNDFLTLAAKIILKEKFDLELDYKQTQNKTENLLNDYHSAIIRGTNTDSEITLDVCEEWFDLVETALPIAFWVCRNDNIIDNLDIYLRNIASHSLPVEESVIEENNIDGTFPRTGKIIYTWNQEVEDALVQTIQYLYYHLYLPDIAAVKVLEKEISL